MFLIPFILVYVAKFFFLPSLLTFGHCDCRMALSSPSLAFNYAALSCHPMELSSKWNYFFVANISCFLLALQDWQALLYTSECFIQWVWKAPWMWKLIRKEKTKFLIKAADFMGSLLIQNATCYSAMHILSAGKWNLLVGTLMLWEISAYACMCVKKNQKELWAPCILKRSSLRLGPLCFGQPPLPFSWFERRFSNKCM